MTKQQIIKELEEKINSYKSEREIIIRKYEDAKKVQDKKNEIYFYGVINTICFIINDFEIMIENIKRG